MHYAHRMKTVIEHLLKVNSEYYEAIYDAKKRAGLDPGIYAGCRMIDNEECLRTNDPEALREIIEELPCPVTLEENERSSGTNKQTTAKS